MGLKTKTRRGAQTSEAILEAAADIFERDGMTALNVDAVARQAEIAPSALYRHFSGKQELGRAVVERHMDGKLERIKSGLARAETIADLRAVFLAMIEGTWSYTPKAAKELIALVSSEYPDLARWHTRARTEAFRAWAEDKGYDADRIAAVLDTLAYTLGNPVTPMILDRADAVERTDAVLASLASDPVSKR